MRAGGSLCPTGDGQSVERQAEVRLACSPDGKNTHLRIMEHSRCQYTLALLAPEVCAHPAMALQPAK